MRLRIILPPNLETSAPRDAIPTKLEIELSPGKNSAPEKVGMDQLAALDEAGRVAAFSLLQWGGGKLGSFLQLDREQLAQLVTQLSGQSCFFWANKPKEPIDWIFSELVGVSEHLGQESSKGNEPISEEQEIEDLEEPSEPELPDLSGYEGTPLRVDGSTHYLAISLPSREHPCYDEIRELVQSYRFKLEPGNRKWWLRDRHQTLNFLGEHWDDLERRYGAEFSANFQQRAAGIPEAKIKTEVIEERNGYNVSVSISAGQASEREISQSLNTGKSYVETNGKVYLLRKDRLKNLQTAQKKLSLDFNAPLLHNGNYKIPYSRGAEVEECLSELNPNFKPPATWRARSEALKDLTRLPAPNLDSSLENTLRGYQKTGVAWLYHLFNHQLGGILADEMGLGKTLQALSFISSLKGGATSSKTRSATQPSLIVCPASLVENWRREAAKFVPHLTVFANHGTNRLQNASESLRYDLIITSYGTLIRDRKLFADISFRCVIGDEAQHIKNRRTLNAKAIATLQTEGRFLLTGTPIENSIQDLMSLLDFIMPGGWKPIPNGARGDERRWHERRILEQAAPYILRRTKQAVATELPEKIEQVLFVDMTPEQKSVYDNARRFAENEISQLEKSGASEGAIRMKTLTQLLRLRQTCCDPRLIDDSLRPEHSSKLNSFSELLEEAMDGEHRILVFSQFVSLLSILKEQLEEQSIPYCYIDGSTRNRMAEVDRFNDSSNIPIFLISLKAGGTGLNLTAADTVVHFDPWWNPAAEAQATDRAHRIGQTKVVTSYKLIVSDSVEEKVLLMQNQKRKLLEDIFEASEAANAKITMQDLKELI
ncbi:DEAD/DEAH box helicase [Pelagicoccus sp. SDUM812003]|uniref:DEAD/DEAH box helicase n=1 Tax=Pelagicoccus sp. SDUM812003 TaxID=3041267 RepID=UPI00280EB41B|nr:DEAD/DEAH box helicase [Pelagicoccus sp. SDUM812003]MDQ8204931.1 DEAD/DEAH box helicase [Pelagicoccus sp. SDUM812003]